MTLSVENLETIRDIAVNIARKEIREAVADGVIAAPPRGIFGEPLTDRGELDLAEFIADTPASHGCRLDFDPRMSMVDFAPGDIVRHRHGGPHYTVMANYGDRATAIRVADITNPPEWAIVHKREF